LPDQHHLWESSSYRVVQPAGADFSTRVAQLLLNDDRVLIDIAPTVGCLCRMPESDRSSELQRSPTPVIAAGEIELAMAPPVVVATPQEEPTPTRAEKEVAPNAERFAQPSRASSVRPAYRRSVTWRRISPRPGAVVARPSAAVVAIADRVPLLRRPAARWAIGALIAAGVLMLGVWLGRRSSRIDPPGSGDRRAIQPRSVQPARDRAL